jgi:hypothetical protein
MRRAETIVRFHRFLGAALATLSVWLWGTGAVAQRPPTDGHVPALASYLDYVQIAEPVVYRQLAVYPILLDRDAPLGRGWLTLDQAVARDLLTVTEKGSGGSVPLVVVENRSPDQNVFLMAGEVLSGGKQTRTIRQDVVLPPGQRADLSVFCVEPHRWEGRPAFSSGKMLLPQSIQLRVKAGADQAGVWAEVRRNNMQLAQAVPAKSPAIAGEGNATGSLAVALAESSVREKLDDARRSLVPRIPAGTAGFLFVYRGRAVGAELFGNAEMARELLPKLLDSYAVDYLVIAGEKSARPERPDHRTAVELFERICRAGSQLTATPAAGQGLHTRADRLLGDGVALSGALVHYGVQVSERPASVEPARPKIIYPRQTQ